METTKPVNEEYLKELSREEVCAIADLVGVVYDEKTPVDEIGGEILHITEGEMTLKEIRQILGIKDEVSEPVLGKEDLESLGLVELKKIGAHLDISFRGKDRDQIVAEVLSVGMTKNELDKLLEPVKETQLELPETPVDVQADVPLPEVEKVEVDLTSKVELEKLSDAELRKLAIERGYVPRRINRETLIEKLVALGKEPVVEEKAVPVETKTAEILPELILAVESVREFDAFKALWVHLRTETLKGLVVAIETEISTRE